jgi:hypothetical protein
VKQLRVDAIKTDRNVDAAEPLPGLTMTFKQPIVVLEDGTLVDGLRRLAAAKASGLEHVPVIILKDFGEAAELLGKVHEDRPCSPRRAWEIMSTLEPLSKSWAYERRVESAKLMRSGKRDKGLVRPKWGGVRALMRKSVGISYDQLSEAIRFLYRRAEQGDTKAIELVARIDRDEIGPGLAHSMYKGTVRLSGDIRDRAEQKILLETGPKRLASVMQSLNRLGSPIQLDQAAIQAAIDSLHSSRTQLTVLINRLRKELTSE